MICSAFAREGAGAALAGRARSAFPMCLRHTYSATPISSSATSSGARSKIGLKSPLAFEPSYRVCRDLLRSASGLVANGTVAAMGCRDMPFCFRAPEAPGRVRDETRVRLDCRESEGEREGVCGPEGERARGEMGECTGGGDMAFRP